MRAGRKRLLRFFVCIMAVGVLLCVGLTFSVNRDRLAQTGHPARSDLQEAVACSDKEAVPREEQRGDFWVLYNYVAARRRFRCWESITYTTHGEYIYMDNLKPVVERWQGPVSVALYAVGEDFKPTLESIRWARSCVPLVADLVTFHVFYDKQHIPKEVPLGESVLSGPKSNCSAPAPWSKVSAKQLHRKRSNLVYPINVGRNVARESATTHFVFASDFELYPSPGTIADFLEMVRRNDSVLQRTKPKVFPLAIFELKNGDYLPENKNQLVSMLKKGTARPFLTKFCPACHSIPASKEWQAANITEGLHVFHIDKRMGKFVHWEPFYIGTNSDPLFDERQSWEGRFNKHTQAYMMCLLDYEFHLLDNAFLVHKPGFRRGKELGLSKQRKIIVDETDKLIKQVFVPEYKARYGNREGCDVK